MAAMANRFVGPSGAMLVLLAVVQCILATPQRTAAFSLQAAVDELHRREAAKYPLNAPPQPALDDWDEDGSAPSAFREREIQPLNAEPAHNELTEQFLREIEEARDRDAVRQWWRHLDRAKTQQEPEQEVEQFEQKKRMRVPPYYLLMQKKRSYPVLPWLPSNGDKRKRFPVAKRSTTNSNPESPLGRTDERVAQELSELFGKPGESQSHNEEKRKRSADEQTKVTTNLPESPPATATALGDMRLEINFQRVNVTPKETPTSAPAGAGELVQHGGHAGHHGGHVPGMSPEYRHRKRSDHAHGENAEDTEADEHDEEGEESSDEDDHDEFDEEDGEADLETEEVDEQRRKKKRAAASLSGNGGGNKHIHAPTVGHLMLRAKKSIDWSQYFGLDRKKKSLQKKENLKKRSDTDSSTNNDEEDDEDDSSEAEKKKRDFDAEKLDSMDKKLQSIEDFIIDETIKYTGAHEGLNSKDDIRRIKDHVLSRLATAYSLERMRRALDKLRRSVDNESHLMRNTIEPESEENALDSNYWLNNKSVKKEQADQLAEDSRPPKDMEKRKRSGYLRYPEQPNTMEEALSLGSAPYETLNDAYLGNKNYIVGSNQCPIIESMAERCRGVDLISGDINQELLPLCGVHQICYLCGASQVACDYQYLAEADSVCGDSNDCQSAARYILMILRGSHGRQLGPRECLKNPCLYRAMREIGL
uniref:RH30075p n=1 Tax=Drosophila melanogaster TaxID=7227 RepID=Q8IGF6_DROME|nr:RH30075p [Drosophila melanogaster]